MRSGNRCPSQLRLARLSKGLRILDIAREAGLAATTISMIERGDRKATPDELSALANALGIGEAKVIELVEEQSGGAG